MSNRELLHKISVFILTFLIYCSIHAQRTSWSSSKKELQDKDFLNQEHLGNIDTLFLLCYGIGNLVFGKKGDEINLRVFLGVGLFFSCVANGLISLFGFYNIKITPLFYLCFILNGFAQSTAWPGVLAVMGHWFGHNSRGTILGLWTTCASVGNLIGYSFASIISIQHNLPWQYLVLTSTSFIFICLLFTIFLLRPYPEDVGIIVVEDEKEENLIAKNVRKISKEEAELFYESITDNVKLRKGIGLFKALKIKGVIQYTLVYSCIKAVNFALILWLAFYLQNITYLKKQASLILQINEISGACFVVIIGYASDKIKSRAILLPFMLLIACVVLFFIPTLNEQNSYMFYILIPISGVMVSTPYNQIGSAIASDIAKNKSLVGETQAISTVIAIIQGFGGIFAAIYQQVAARQFNYFFVLVSSLATILVLPITWRDISDRINKNKQKQQNMTQM